MNTPLEIHFHGLEKSDAIETRVREKFAKIESHFDRISSARVVIEAPHRNPEKVKVLQVKIEVSVPGQKPIFVKHDRESAHTHDDVLLALRDAFAIAQRQVDQMSEKMASRGRTEHSRRRPRVMSDDGGSDQ